MKTYERCFVKTVWGHARVEAENEEEARDKFDVCDCDEFDNKSEYEWDDKIKKVN